MSIDDFSAAIGTAIVQAEQTTSAIGAARSTGDELAGKFSALSADGKVSRTQAVVQRLETNADAMAAQLRTALEEIRQQAEALRDDGGLAGSSGATAGNQRAASEPYQVSGPARHNTIKPPNERHLLHRIGRSSRPDAQNTVILPGVDVEGDLKAIRNGQAKWNPRIDRYEINDRTWAVKLNGTTFPDSGPGFVKLNRAEYKALKGLIQAGGDMARRPQELVRNPSISAIDWDRAAEIYRYHPRNGQGKER